MTEDHIHQAQLMGTDPQCFFCGGSATKVLLWAGGARRLDVCAAHLDSGLRQVMDINKSTVQHLIDLAPPIAADELGEELTTKAQPTVGDVHVGGPLAIARPRPDDEDDETPLFKVSLEEMVPAKLAKTPKDELQLAWLRLSQWYASAKREGRAVENFVNAAAWVLRALQDKGVVVDTETPLARAAQQLGKQEEPTTDDGDLVVVKDFVCVVGSSVQADATKPPNDMDVLFRARRDAEDNFLIQAENIWLQARKALDPDKEETLHFIDNPQGPHADYMPVYDLVLRRRKDAEVQLVKARSRRFTPPKAVRAAAKRGLALREKWDRGGLSPSEAAAQGIGSGVRRAKQLAAGESLSVNEINRVNAFLSRHKRNYAPDKKDTDGGPTAGTIAYLLWGGEPAQRWVDDVLQDIEKAASSGGVYAAFKVHPTSADRLYDWLNKTVLKTCKSVDRVHRVAPADMHATTVYSRRPFKGYKPRAQSVIVKPERLKLFGNTLVLTLESDVLKQQYEQARSLGASWDYETYEPHVTLCTEFYGTVDALRPPSFMLRLGNEYIEPLDPGDEDETPLKLNLGCGDEVLPGYTGIDRDPAAAGVDRVHDLALGIPASDDSVAVVRANHSLEHLEDMDKILREVHRVLKPGGVFVFEVPSTAGDGAFAHPEHKTFYNLSSFAFWTDPALIEDRPRFEVDRLEEVGTPPRVYVRGKLRKPLLSNTYLVSKARVRPFTPFTPPKPLLAGVTELFSVDALWDWATGRLPVMVGPKWNGFRVVAERQGDRLRLWSEGKADVDLLPKLPTLGAALRKLTGDWVLDADLGIERDGKRLPRPELMRFNRDKIEFEADEYPVLTVFDLPYYDEPLGDEPVEARKRALDRLTLSDKKLLRVSPDRMVNTKAQLEDAVRWGFKFDRSEGVVAKAADSPYPTGGTSDWSKLKKVVELKVVVLDRKKVKTGWNYRGGLAPSKGDVWSNTMDGYIDLGWSFNTEVKADNGDILTVHVLELVPDKAADTLTWLGANVLDVDASRQTPYTTSQAVDVARRGGVLQHVAKQKDEEGDTRAASAERFWKDNWDSLYPKSGEGDFVFQHHWRGLSDDEKASSDKQLLETDHSVHGDLRFEADDALWGFSVFIGTAADNKRTGGDRLLALSGTDKPLRGTFKLAQPKDWLTVGVDKPFVSEPGGVGATSQTWAKFFALDHGTYEMGVRHRHFVEVFLHGNKLKGRYLIQSVPIGKEGRAWMVTKPEDQKPFIETNTREDTVKRLKARGHKALIWAGPGVKPQRVSTTDRVQKDYVVKIAKQDKDQQIITGVVMEPDVEDLHGDYISAPEIEAAAHKFLVRSRVVGLQHKKKGPIEVIESYIAPKAMQIGTGHVRAGSWIMSVKVRDADVWAAVKAGKYTGFSIGGTGMRKTTG
jgi:SAM-dependent methyltransferase